MQNSSYALVSACRNEEAYIEELIATVAAQTLLPRRWLIVDDGSTDNTYSLARTAGKSLKWLEVVRTPNGRPRSFASQVYAAQHGYELLRSDDIDFIGFLDADIRLPRDYYEQIVERLCADPGLGLCGGAVLDQYNGYTMDTRQGSEDYHVAGGIQFFRRQCFELIGGYIPVPAGGQDTIADVMVMMKGWQLRTYPDLVTIHLRPDGHGKDNLVVRGLKRGRESYTVGYHPLFYLMQCLRRLGRRPIIIGSVCQALGFLGATMRSRKRPVPMEFVRFHRKLQMRRLREMMAGWLARD